MATLKLKYNPVAKSFQYILNEDELLEKNAINGSFTTTDGKIITIVNGQITKIEEI